MARSTKSLIAALYIWPTTLSFSKTSLIIEQMTNNAVDWTVLRYSSLSHISIASITFFLAISGTGQSLLFSQSSRVWSITFSWFFTSENWNQPSPSLFVTFGSFVLSESFATKNFSAFFILWVVLFSANQCPRLFQNCASMGMEEFSSSPGIFTCTNGFSISQTDRRTLPKSVSIIFNSGFLTLSFLRAWNAPLVSHHVLRKFRPVSSR